MSKFAIRNVIVVIVIAFFEWSVDPFICNAREGLRRKVENFTTSTVFNVIKYGAKGDGIADDTKAFQEAWNDTCKLTRSTILVPSGFMFLLKPTIFLGDHCASNIIFQLDGKLVAPENPKAWSSSPQAWILFESIKGITFQGKGILDGKGSIWWKDSSNNSSHDGSNYSNYISSNNWLIHDKSQEKLPSAKPIALMFARCSNIMVIGITIQNSPLKHLKIYSCAGVKIARINISSPGDSPNTDGINLSSAQDVVIRNVNISCGDDCISILGGCSNIEIYGINCGPGHGLSIGGLGRGSKKDIVYNITIHDSTVQNAMTAVRIKTWQGGSGMAKLINFTNIQTYQVKTPIIIDQYYCDKGINCRNQTSVVVVSGITYESIRGTYTVRAASFACSDSFPCKDITLTSIELNSTKGVNVSNPFCWNAFRKVLTKTTPPITCLRTKKEEKFQSHNYVTIKRCLTEI